MTFALSTYSVTYFAATALSIVAASFAWSRRTAPGGRWLFLMLVASAAWAAAEAGDYSSTRLVDHIFWGKVSYFGATTTAVFFLLFALEYSGRGKIVTRWFVAALFVPPAAAIVTVWTNEAHHLVWTGFAALEGVPHAILYSHGPAYWVITIYGLTLTAIATAIILGIAIRMRELYRYQSALIIAAVLLPWIGEILYSVDASLVRGIDPAVTVSVTGAILTVTMLRFKLLDLVPVARETLVERMSDGLLILDSQCRVIDINPAARFLLGIEAEKCIGAPVDTLLTSWPEASEFMGACSDIEAETRMASPDGVQVGFDVVPLVQGDQPGGTLVILRDLTAFTLAEDNLRRYNDDLNARIAEIEELQAELNEQVIRDPLTGLFNRRYLAETIQREFGRAGREGYPVSLIMLDIDDFKHINDQYGHAAGDAVLRTLGSLLRANSRIGDMPCRYGGDEFLVVLPNTGVDTAAALAERWRGIFETRSPLIDDEHAFTISLGVASFPEHGATSDEVTAAADSAVYAAKAAGRNRVCVAPPGA